MIDPGNAVREVWAARDRIWEKIKDMTPDEQIRYFNRKGRKFAKKYGLKYHEPVNRRRNKRELKTTT